MGLGLKLLELISEALCLNPNHLKDMDCAEGLLILCHYYPACPQPELTMASTRHSDNDFLTILLQDQIGGLQVLHQDQWVDIPPVPGALVINVGDLLQLITNDRFKSVEHRVLANRRGPRVSVACFFSTSSAILKIIWTYQGIVIRRESTKIQGNDSERLCSLFALKRAWWDFCSTTFQALNWSPYF
ncbi:hypothetical protein VitviT2T_006671 [Vitis vinifera]|uniref:Fe2OG dioxygenase domain-containing protein n=1 Tax=Vitis vinifera TaxID=29760 RepID=A0ABY9BZ38_VITVI|nr:hypothetical protein VitviT2T_006671 [Vitis vinifera]